jgi:hypothetical protein
MSLFVDLKYLKLISNRLVLFKQKSDRLYNCRCPICGDSASKKNKARGYFFPHKNNLLFKCHNCGVSLGFGSFLKDFDPIQYGSYSLETFEENHQNTRSSFSFVMNEPRVAKKKEPSLIDQLLSRLDTLPEDNEAVQFCRQRKIPDEKFDRLYYIPHVADLDQLNPKYRENIKGREPRLVLPFFDRAGQMTGVTCRALDVHPLRYITAKIREDDVLVFGLPEVDKTRDIYVVEGPIDSLFLDNAIAVSGTSFGKLSQLDLPNDRLVVVFDNQPRNREVVKLLGRVIDAGFRTVIWPQTLEEKDINDMVLAGKDAKRIIKDNTYEGLTARAKHVAWKRC